MPARGDVIRMNPHLKLACTVNALFGPGTARHVPRDVRFEYSRTGRIRGVYLGDGLLCTLRIDGGLALTPRFAQMLLAGKTFRESCVEVNGEAAPFVEEGRSVFAKHVVWCGRNVRVSADTPVLYGDRVIAVGRAVLSREMMSGCMRGVAVRTRGGVSQGHMRPAGRAAS